MELRRTVAHCANPFLPVTMVWAYDQIRSLTRYRPVVLTQAVQNRDVFPVDHLFSAEDLPAWEQGLYRVVRKVRGTYAGYVPILQRARVGVLHAHFGQEGYRCLSASRGAGVPLVTSFYGLDVSQLPRRRSWRRRFGRLFDEGERFLVEGSHMGERLVDLGCPPEKVCLQRLGVDLDQIPFCPPESRGDGASVVLMYATFREKKGHIYGLRAFHRVLDAFPAARMRVIGDGPLRAEIAHEIQILDLAGRVSLLGMRPHAECLEELRQATVLLYPSVTASDGDTEGGAPVGLIEAMASGLPIVSSWHADIPEVVPDGRCGLLARERDVAGLAKGLEAVLGCAQLRKSLGKAGRAHVEANHNLRQQGRRLEAIYDRVVEG